MSHSLERLLRKQLKAQQSAYLSLLDDVRQTKSELAKVVKRLELLRRLLALEGQQVEMPSAVSKVNQRRKTA